MPMSRSVSIRSYCPFISPREFLVEMVTARSTMQSLRTRRCFFQHLDPRADVVAMIVEGSAAE